MEIIVYIDGKASYKTKIEKTDSISHLKTILRDFKDKRFFINEKQELEVFNTDTYDNLKFLQFWDKMKNPKIYVKSNTKKETKSNTKSQSQSQTQTKVFAKNDKRSQLTGIKDVDLKILLNLSYNDLLQVEKVSQYMKKLLTDKYFWLSKLETDFSLRSKYIYYRKYLMLKRENPRELYEIIIQKSKIIYLPKYFVSATSEILLDLFNEYDRADPAEDDNDVNGVNVVNKINEILQENLINLPLLRGDMVTTLQEERYRNDNLLCWDGNKFLALNFSADDYGAIPKEMTFPEFPLNHFSESIDHNNIIWLSAEKVQEAIQNMKISKNESEISDMYYKYKLRVYEDEEYDEFPEQYKNREFLTKRFLEHPFVEKLDDEYTMLAAGRFYG